MLYIKIMHMLQFPLMYICEQLAKAILLWHALSVCRTCQSKVSNCELHRRTRPVLMKDPKSES